MTYPHSTTSNPWDLSRKAFSELKQVIHDTNYDLHELKVYRMDSDEGGSKRSIPSSIVFLPKPESSEYASPEDQLFLDGVPIPPDCFKFNRQDRILTWKQAYGGGFLFFSDNGSVGHGVIGSPLQLTNVKVGATNRFTCDIAPDVDAKYIQDGDKITGISWDCQSQKWQHADWDDSRLDMKYTVIDGGNMFPDELLFEFIDRKYDFSQDFEISGVSEGDVSMEENDSGAYWKCWFKSNKGTEYPLEDLFIPTWLESAQNQSTTVINGAFCKDAEQQGDLYGLKGQRVLSTISGYYSTGKRAAPFSIFNASLQIDGESPNGLISRVIRNELHWTGLSQTLQEKTGLPGAGVIRYTSDGWKGVVVDSTTSVFRLRFSDFQTSIQEYPDMYPRILASYQKEVLSKMGSSSDQNNELTIDGLNVMSPYVQDDEQRWFDQVQQNSTKDMWTIMNSYVPSKVWEKLFPGIHQPEREGYLSKVAETPVTGENGEILRPGEFYESLSTMVICMSLRNSDDEYAKRLNAMRAETRLKERTSSSPLYKEHMKMLFLENWKKKETFTDDYLSDQRDRAQEYALEIQERCNSQIQEIEESVFEEKGSTVKQELKDLVNKEANYAIEGTLYWAFCYYTYHTSPGMLAKIQSAIKSNTDNADGTFLTRRIQQNMSVLTALDPSGFFADSYTNSMNAFLGSTVLMSLIDFDNTSIPIDLFAEHLEAFLQKCLESHDLQLIQVAQAIKSLLDAEGITHTLERTLNVLRKASQKVLTSAPSLVTAVFFHDLCEEFPSVEPKSLKMLGSAVMLGVAGFEVIALLMGFSNFDEFSDWQKAEIIASTVQFAMEGFVAIVKGGKTIGDLFGASGLSMYARFASFGKPGQGSSSGIINEALSQLADGVKRVGQTLSKWLGETAGGVSRALKNLGGARVPKYFKLAMGKNLDQFVATRIGPIFVLCGLVFSIAGICRGDSGLSLAADIVGIVEGTLALFSVVGGWAVSTFGIVGPFAAIVSCAGPLSVVLALVGIGILFAILFKKPPNPYKEFLKDEAEPVNLAMPSECRAVDYAVGFFSDAKGYELVGITLSPQSSPSTVLIASPADGSVRLGNCDYTPNCVLQIQTTGSGMSAIGTSVGSDGEEYSTMQHLTVSPEGNVIFEENPSTTEVWRATASYGDAILEDGNVSRMQISIQFCCADSGYYGKYLDTDSSGNVILGESPRQWTLGMSGMKPVGMNMQDHISFLSGYAVSKSLKYQPSFPLMPSEDTSFSLRPKLPEFLTFDETDGKFSPTDASAGPIGTTVYTIEASNKLGSTICSFSIEVISS